ncbi:hypothetical protein CBS101457_003468 [Exobasidium rhododendri]|nr:hypothetical protein CBS101457_003468 [Exobasidium rhododendri]
MISTGKVSAFVALCLIQGFLAAPLPMRPGGRSGNHPSYEYGNGSGNAPYPHQTFQGENQGMSYGQPMSPYTGMPVLGMPVQHAEMTQGQFMANTQGINPYHQASTGVYHSPLQTQAAIEAHQNLLNHRRNNRNRANSSGHQGATGSTGLSELRGARRSTS